MKKFFTAFTLTLLSCVVLVAQIETPMPSPTAKFTQTVGLTDITIEYSRPGVKDRVIFAEDGLVPFGQMWRTGANAATTIEFSKDVVFGGQDVEAGKYALYTVPNADSWDVMLYSDTSLGGNTDAYDESKEVARVSVEPQEMSFSLETFTIDIGKIRDNSAVLGLIWDRTYVPVELKVHTDKQVLEQIEEFTSNPMATIASNYLNSGWYLYNSGENLDKAHEYMQKGLKYADSPFVFFWTHRAAIVQAAKGDYKGAIETAKKAHKQGMSTDNANAKGFYEGTVKAEIDENIKKWSSKS